MKIKSIAAICKKNKNIAIFERYSDDGDILTQYIGDGSAVYPVVGLPQLDKESLLTIFDVPEKDRDNYFVKTLGVPVGISFEDTDETERHVEREGISIIYSGRTLKPIRTTRGLVFIESRYLSPVADVLDVLELYERRTAEGAPYIVAKAGFLLQAVIMPYDVINQQFVESLQSLTRECEFSLSEKERREREAIALQRFIEERHSKPAGFGMALSAALISYAVVNGRKCGRTTDYMKDGKGYPLNYCPSCGKRVKNE